MSQEVFIRHHQMNFIRNEINKLKYALIHAADKSVIEGVKYRVETSISELFPLLPEHEKNALFSVQKITSDVECEEYVNKLSSYVIEFPRITEKQIKKLFPKNKKLKIPDLTSADFGKMSYLSWTDISTSKLFLIYPLSGTIVGVECRFSVSNKHNVCAICHTPGSPGQVGLVTALCKPGRSSSPDYYKSVGNYMCLDSNECNKHIKDVAYLEKFLHEVLNHRELS